MWFWAIIWPMINLNLGYLIGAHIGFYGWFPS